MRHAIAFAAMLLIAGCVFRRAHVADQAQHQLVGMNKGQILSCMGAPAGQTAADNVEVWSYPSGGRTDTFAAGQTYASGTGVYNGITTGPTTTGVYSGSGSATSFGSSTSVNRYCVVSVVFNGDQVSAVNYQGRTGGLITQGEECAYAVQNCVH